MEDIELNVGGTTFKGVWIAILLSFASTIGGGIWAASEFFSRLEAQEEAVAGFGPLEETVAQFAIRVAGVEQSISDNDVSQLQGKLAELGTNIAQIMEQQKQLLDLRERIAAVEKSNSETVLIVESKVKEIDTVAGSIKSLQTEVNDLWDGLDAVANPLR